jgi:spermidine/putrescine transport system substrate-binding protein
MGSDVTSTVRYLGWLALDKPEAAQILLGPRKTELASTYVRNGSDLLRQLTSRRPLVVDLISPSTDFSPSTLSELEPLLEPLDLERIPSVGDQWAGFQKGPWDRSSGSATMVPVLWGDSPIVYDPKVVDKVPSSYADLADPYWKGKVVVRNELYCVLWMLSAALGHNDPFRITRSQLKDVQALAREIKANTVRVAGSYREMADMLVAGEAAISISGWQIMCRWAELGSGVELRFDTPANDPKFWWVDGYAILRTAPNKDAAYDLINYYLAPEVNAGLAWDLQSCVTNTKAWDLMPSQLRAMYDPELVKTATNADGPISSSISWLPPLERDGDIAGDADWRSVWLDFLLS